MATGLAKTLWVLSGLIWLPDQMNGCTEPAYGEGTALRQTIFPIQPGKDGGIG